MNKKYNVIYLMSDQHRAQACSYAGNTDVYTPNMDSLARQGVNFVNAVSCMPVCGPYRASFLTGQYPHQHGIFLNDLCLDPRATTIGKVFKDNGYDTAYIGKWHLDGHGRSAFIPEERRQGFDYWKVLECTHDYNDSKYYDNEDKVVHSWHGYDALAQTDDAISFLKTRDHEKPLFMVLAWGPPHPPYHSAPKEFQEIYKNKIIDPRPNVPIESKMVFNNIKGYYAHISAIDFCIGRIINTLDETGIKDDTILVYTSDHGDMLGSQGVYEKHSPWEESIRVPFLMKLPPKLLDCPKKVLSPINSPDIMPTLLDLCEINCPSTVSGESFKSDILDEEKLDRVALLQCIQPNGTWHKNNGGREYRGIRTRRYTYVEDLNGPWLFYDNEIDPYQLNNILDSLTCVEIEEEYTSCLKNLQQLLKKKMNIINDDFKSGQFYLAIWNYGSRVNFLNTIPFEL